MHSAVIQRGMKRRSEELPGLAGSHRSASADCATLAWKPSVCVHVSVFTRCLISDSVPAVAFVTLLVTHNFSHDISNSWSKLFLFTITGHTIEEVKPLNVLNFAMVFDCFLIQLYFF